MMMKKFLATFVLLILAASLLASPVTVIMAGQSNMSGAGQVLEQDRVPDIAPIVVITTEVGIRDSQEPWKAGGTSVGRSFARYIWQHDPTVTQVWMAVCSQGSTSAAQWLPNAVDGLTDECVRIAQRAEAMGAPVVAVLWMQGETDSGIEALAVQYWDRLRRIIAGFWARLGHPAAFVAAEIPSHLPPGRLLYRQVVVDATRELTDGVAGRAFVETGDLTQMVPDSLHWDRGALRVIGTRMGAALVDLHPEGLGVACAP